MKFVLSAVAMCLLTVSVWAQSPQPNATQMPAIGSIIGKVTAQGQPAEYATVQVYSKRQRKVVTGGVTDEKGNFQIEQLAPGKYAINISAIGFKAFASDTFLLTPQDPTKRFGEIKLQTNEQSLKAVEVTAEQASVQTSIDKKVYNVEKNLNNVGGSVTSVLQNLPGVTVDNDNNVSLRGSGSVRILIDGKLVPVTDENRGSYLEQLPAGAIESVEIVTNPSAKYDADGMAGIINIITKKNKLQGLNGTVNLTAGTRNKYGAGLNLNYRTGKVNIYGNYNYRYNEFFFKGFSNRINKFSDTNSYQYQNFNNINIGQSNLGRVGMDYNISPNDVFSVSGGFTMNENLTLGTVQYDFRNNENNTTGTSTRKNRTPGENIGGDANISYRHTFVNSAVLSAEASYNQNANTNNASYFQTFTDANGQSGTPNYYQHIRNASEPRLFTAQTDYTQSLFGKKGKIETGYKATVRNIKNEIYAEEDPNGVGFYTPQSAINNRYNYKDEVYAQYVNVAYTPGKFGVQLGNRIELSNVTGTQYTTNQLNRQHYLNFFPSAFFSLKPKAGTEFSLNYSRRINRPGPGQLNPFADYTDPLNLRQGNPNLRPEYTNSFELGYQHIADKNSITASTYFRQTDNMTQRIRTVYPNGISVVQFQNIATGLAYGAEITDRYDITKTWNVNANVNLFMQEVKGSTSYGAAQNSGFSYMARVISNWKVVKIVDLQATYAYMGPVYILQGSIKPMHGLDVGLRKEIWKGKGSLGLSVTDVFNTRKFAINSSGTNFVQNFEFKRESQIATFSFTYRFGKAQGGFSRKKEGEDKPQMPSGDVGF